MMKNIKGKIGKGLGSVFSVFYQTSLHILLVGLFVFAIFLGLFYTNPGAKLSFGLMNLFLTHPIQVQTIEGTLAGPLTLKKITVENPEFSFSADVITANWAADALQYIRKSIHIKQLKVDNIKIIYHSNKDSWFTEIPSLENLGKQLKNILKVELKIEDFQARQIALHFGQEPIHIQSFTFTRGASHENHLFKTLQVQAQQGALIFDQSASHIKLKWDFKVSELHDFIPVLKGDITTTGNLILHDLNQIDQDTIIQLHLKSKEIKYQDYHLQNAVFHIAGNFEKHQVSVSGKFNDHHVDAGFVGNLDRLTRSHWQGDLKKLLIHHKRFGKLPPSTGKIQIQVDKLKNTAQSNITMNILGNNAMTAHFLIDQTPSQLSGQIQAQLVDLDFLIKSFPQLEDIHGDALVNLNVKGDLWDPILWGNVALKDCTIDSTELSNLSTSMHLSTLNLESAGDGKLNINGKGTMGKGNFTLEGTSDFTEDKPIVDLSLKGKNLTLSQTPEYFIIADPNLRLQLKDNRPYLSGTIFIPHAEIETQVFGSDMIEPSHDMVIINSAHPLKPEPVAQSPLSPNIDYGALTTNINIELGDKIRYKGFGLESHIAGKLNIFTQNSNLHAHGKLNLVNGRFRAHGNILDIQHGYISFLGDQISNPTWDIQAAKQIYTPIQNKLFKSAKKQQDTVFFESDNNTMMPHKPILVGVTLKGTVQNPILKMFSVPTLKEADIISYLVLNKPQRDASEAQTTLVLEAANELFNFLGNNKRDDVKIDLAKSLKLDKFGLSQVATCGKGTVGQNDFKQTALVIGKQLSKKLYAEYSLRVLDTASTVSLRYLVGKHIVLEGSASKDSASGDILFTFESG